MTTTAIWTIVEWFLYGAVRYILYWVPALTPFSVGRPVPWQWFRYNDWWDWGHSDDNNGGPNEHWLNSWFEMCIGELKVLAVEEAKPYVDVAKVFLLGVIGGIRVGHTSMGSWVDLIQRSIGYYVPSWASSIVNGIEIVRNKLPSGIKLAWQTWDDLFETIRSRVRSWARDRYDFAKQRAFGAFDWIINFGDSLRGWRDHVSGWIDHVRNNSYGWVIAVLGGAWSWLVGFYQRPGGVIRGFLGPDWGKMVTFARECIDFYYGLWSRGWRVLGDFTEDPLGSLYVWAEQILTERW